MDIRKLPGVMCVLFAFVPGLAAAQADPGTSPIAAVPADSITVSFTVPLDEIQSHYYHIKTFTSGSEDGMLTTATRPDASGVIDTNFFPAHLSASPEIASEDYFHSFLAAFNHQTNEWHYQMNLAEVSLKRFLIALAASRSQPTGPVDMNRRQSNTPRPNIFGFAQDVPEDVRIRLNGERLSLADISSQINRQTGCVISEESGILKIAQC